MPASHIRVYLSPRISASDPASCRWIKGGSRCWLKCLGPCHPCWETWVEVLAPSFGLAQLWQQSCCRPMGSKWAGETLSFCMPVCLSAFQVGENKYFKKRNGIILSPLMNGWIVTCMHSGILLSHKKDEHLPWQHRSSWRLNEISWANATRSDSYRESKKFDAIAVRSRVMVITPGWRSSREGWRSNSWYSAI